MAGIVKHWTVLLLCAILNVPLCGGDSRVCTYFGVDRTPAEAYSLSNCTWYRENACCKRTEVASVFSEMPALLTSDKGCYNRMNHLMCYFCSPKQSLWYNQTLSICRSYCDEIFSYCGSAKYNGQSIAKNYENGKKFCEALAFNVVANKKESKNCFDFDPDLFDGVGRTGVRLWLMVAVIVINVYIQWNN